MSGSFEKIKKNFGFGAMRLPMENGVVDLELATRMVDTFMEMGFNYFDTAHGYMEGKSETTLRHCLTSRYPRESYVLTNKLSGFHFKTQEEIRPLFESQLEACGVDYFDFYLMHAQDKKLFAKYKRCKAYETALELKAEGKIRHLGISFHDNAEMLEEILTQYPQIEVVQLQFNYADYDSPSVQSGACYQVCRKFGKPVIVMEPVKGGVLVNLPDKAKKVFDDLQGGSYASYAIRFAAGFEGIMMVLSGMGNMEMVQDNCGYMQDFKPLTKQELTAVKKVRGILAAMHSIPCTACRYCTEVCPQEIPIPEFFACYNAQKLFNNWNSGYYFRNVQASGASPADCINCGMCEGICPQHLEIRDLLTKVAAEFEKKEG